MPTEILLPKLGETMESATVAQTLVGLDEFVKKGQPLFEIETDKAAMEIESPEGGYVKHILVSAGSDIPVGAVMMILGQKDEEISAEFAESLKTDSLQKSREHFMAQAEHFADDTEITDAELKEGVEAQRTLSTAKLKLGDTIELSRFQKLTARRMLLSKRQIPCFYLTAKVDMTNLAGLRDEINQSGNIRISYNDFVIKAMAAALRKYPLMTGQIEGDFIKLAEDINIALAVTVADDLIAPVIKSPDKKTIPQIAAQSRELIARANENRLALADLEGACITLSNLGGYGIDAFIPIVVPGQASILGLGRIIETPMPEKADFAVRKIMKITLSADHRIINGAYAAEFLDAIRYLLEAADFDYGS